MSEPFLAEIRMIGFKFPPRGWGFCDGQILPINQNQNLYSLLGTTYGGDGRTSFALPDLRGRTPLHVNDGFNNAPPHALGSKAGEEAHVLTETEMPLHTHTPIGSSNTEGRTDAAGLLLGSPAQASYAAPPTSTTLGAQTLATAGSGQAHPNMQPWLAVNFCIALRGLFPSRN